MTIFLSFTISWFEGDAFYQPILLFSPAFPNFSLYLNVYGREYCFKDIDLKNFGSLTFRVSASVPRLKLNVKADDPEGKTMASVEVSNTQGVINWKEITVSLENTPSGKHTLFFVISASEKASEKASASIDWIYFNNGAGKSKEMAVKQ